VVLTDTHTIPHKMGSPDISSQKASCMAWVNCMERKKIERKHTGMVLMPV
jgi:hypothetical protein